MSNRRGHCVDIIIDIFFKYYSTFLKLDIIEAFVNPKLNSNYGKLLTGVAVTLYLVIPVVVDGSVQVIMADAFPGITVRNDGPAMGITDIDGSDNSPMKTSLASTALILNV